MSKEDFLSDVYSIQRQIENIVKKYNLDSLVINSHNTFVEYSVFNDEGIEIKKERLKNGFIHEYTLEKNVNGEIKKIEIT